RTRTSRSSTWGCPGWASGRVIGTSNTTSGGNAGSREGPDRTSPLQIAEVSKSFGRVLAVNRVSLEVRRGEILSVIGPNGAGQTTLLNMLSGFYHPDQGRITLDATDITQSAPSRVAELGVARTFQNIALFKGMTVLDNLMLGRHVHMRAGVLSS